MPRREHRGEVSTRRDSLQPITGLSVTPLLGVVIVLVLGYVVTLDPHRAIDVHLPVEPVDAPGAYKAPCEGSGVVLSVFPDGTFDINRQDVPRDILEQRLREVFGYRRCSAIFILAAPEVRYGTVTDFVDAAKGAGIRHIVMLITQGDGYFSAELPR